MTTGFQNEKLARVGTPARFPHTPGCGAFRLCAGGGTVLCSEWSGLRDGSSANRPSGWIR